jgi:hypothetical protein
MEMMPTRGEGVLNLQLLFYCRMTTILARRLPGTPKLVTDKEAQA